MYCPDNPKTNASKTGVLAKEKEKEKEKVKVMSSKICGRHNYWL